VRVEELVPLLTAVAAGDRSVVLESLAAVPSLATARLARRDEFFVARCNAQAYEGDTALHAATFAYDVRLTRDLVARGADVRARNRRGAEPDARTLGGVTPLHRAVRNRCSAAVEALLRAGADPLLANDRGSTAADLAHQPTGRGGAGSDAATLEQRAIIGLLE
jgi:hypothetical protein